MPASFAGYNVLGHALAGGNAPNAALMEAQGEQLGANTENAIAQANQRIAENKARAKVGPAAAALPGSSPELGTFLGTAAEGGFNPEPYLQGIGANQKNRAGEMILNPATSDQMAARANLVRDPQSHGLISSLGEGQLANALHPEGAPIQTPISTSTVAKNTGEAAHAQAQANLADAEARNNPHVGAPVDANGNPKPPANFQWAVDADGNPVLDENGQPKLAYITGGGKDPNAPAAMGSREAAIFQRVLASASLGTKAIANVARGPVGQSAGVMGIGAVPGHSALASTLDTLRNTLSPEEVQQYNVMNAGLSRNLSNVESSGMVAPGQFSDQIGAGTTMRAGDTEETKLMRLAETRQILEVGMQTALSNPRVPKAQKAVLQSHIDELKAAIPFSVEDVQGLKAAPAGTNLQDVISGRGLRKPAAGAAPAAAPAASATPPAGWTLHQDANGNRAYVSPDGKQFQEAQ